MAASMTTKICSRIFGCFTQHKRMLDNSFSSSKKFCRLIFRYVPKYKSRFDVINGGKYGRVRAVSIFGLAGAIRCLSLFSKKEEDKVLMNVKKARLALMQQDAELAEILYHEALKAADDKWKNSESQDLEYAQAKTYIFDGLADIAMSKGDFEKAEKLYKETMKGCLQTGKEKTDNAMVELSIKLATIYAITNKELEAVQGYEYAIETQEEKLKNNQDSDVDTRALLGLALESYGRYKLIHSELDNALGMLKRAAEIAKSVLGESNPQTLILMNDIATAYIMKKDYLHAEKVIRETIIIAEEAKVPELSTFYCNLGSLFLRMSKLDEAKYHCEVALKKSKTLKDVYGAEQAMGCLRKIKEARQDS